MSPAVKLKVVSKPQTLGALIDQLDDAREVKRKIAVQADAAQEVYKDLEKLIFAKLDSEDSRTGEGKKAGASISITIVAEVEDPTILHKWISRTHNYQLYSNTLSAPAYRELLEMKGAVPGVKPKEVRRLNLRSL